MDNRLNETMKFEAYMEKASEVQIIFTVYNALKEKGYDR